MERGYTRINPVVVEVDGKPIQMINSYGFYSAKYVHMCGLRIIEERKSNMYSKSQCRRMKRPVKDNEAPVAFKLAMHGYYPLYQRD